MFNKDYLYDKCAVVIMIYTAFIRKDFYKGKNTIKGKVWGVRGQPLIGKFPFFPSLIALKMLSFFWSHYPSKSCSFCLIYLCSSCMSLSDNRTSLINSEETKINKASRWNTTGQTDTFRMVVVRLYTSHII